MGVTKHWLKSQSFARNIERTVDRESLLDLLGIVIYEADRSIALEDAGSEDTSAVDCLFDYVLDALGVPAETEAFSREPFESLFYNDFWLEKRYASTCEALLALEAQRDGMVQRAGQAATNRAGIRVVKSDNKQAE